MNPLALVNLERLMERTSGKPEIAIGLIDGPITDHPDLSTANIRRVSSKTSNICSQPDSIACKHGTSVAGILFARRGSVAPSICPDCTALVCSILPEHSLSNGELPSAKSRELADAISDTVDAGARVLNLSVAIVQPCSHSERYLEEALTYAAHRGTIVVAAAGNQGTIASSAITRHSWVIPVVGCDSGGRPTPASNLGFSVGRNGVLAPGDDITSLASGGGSDTFGGTSAATAFVTGTIALLWSEFPSASAARLKSAIVDVGATIRKRIVPHLLDAWEAYRTLANINDLSKA